MKDLYKQIAISLASVIVCLLGFYLVEARNYTTRIEVSNMITTEAPYVKDKGRIVSELHKMEENNQRIYDIISKNTDAVNKLQAEIARLSAILEQLQREK